MSVEKKIREFLSESFQTSDSQLSVTTNLVESGIVDSSGILELIDFLEQEFAIVISDEDITADCFDTIETIEHYVKEKQQES